MAVEVLVVVGGLGRADLCLSSPALRKMPDRDQRSFVPQDDGAGGWPQNGGRVIWLAITRTLRPRLPCLKSRNPDTPASPVPRAEIAYPPPPSGSSLARC